MNLRIARKSFRSPPRNHHPIALWFGRDFLDPDRLLAEFDAAIEAGMGGAALSGLSHQSRDNEKAWTGAMSALVRRAYRKKASIGLHDVPLADHPGAAAQSLRLDVHERGSKPLEWGPDWVAVFRLDDRLPASGRPPRFANIERETTLDTEAACHAVFRRETMPLDFNFLDARSTGSFISRVYDPYQREFRRYFGHSLLHSFVGEAGLAVHDNAIPWDPDIETVFRETRGYPLVPQLPALFHDVEGFERIRFDFWTLIAEMFREAFAAPLDAWCRKHRLMFSGHYAAQAPVCIAAPRLGAAMALHEFEGRAALDVPLEDFLRFEAPAARYAAATMALKQAASVDHQLGKGGLLTGSYRPGPIALAPERVRAAANVQMALGAGFIGLHDADRAQLDSSSLTAAARTSWLLTQGRHACEVLLLHPVACVQAGHSGRPGKGTEAAGWIDRHASALSLALLDAQIDFDYGDPEILARHGRVDRKRLAVGQQQYSIAVLPPMMNLRSTTLELLMDFAVAGGAVISVGSAPTMIDGVESGDGTRFVTEYAERIIDGIDRFDYSRAVRAVRAKLRMSPTVERQDGGTIAELKMHRRTWEETEILFVANEGEWSADFVLRFPNRGECAAEEWDTESGEGRALAPETSDTGPFLRWQLGPGRARAIVLFQGKAPISPSE